jgi:hypothetical protein
VVQVDSIKPVLKASLVSALETHTDKVLSSLASNFNLRHYTTVVPPGDTAALPTAAVGPDATVHLHVRRFVQAGSDATGREQPPANQAPPMPTPYHWGVRWSLEGVEGGAGSRLLAGAEEGAEVLMCAPPRGGGSGSAAGAGAPPRWWVSLQTETTPVTAGAAAATAMATATHAGVKGQGPGAAAARQEHRPSAMLDWQGGH